MPPFFQRKIVNQARLLDMIRQARADGKSIVQCHGCFDIVHPGHIRYLEFARRQGDVLVVSLTGDPNIDKGDQRPYIPEELRAESLAALEFVDIVCVDPNPTAEQILDVVRPDVYVKGREYELSRDPRFAREREIVEQNGGRVIFSSGDVVFSSTHLIDNLPRDPEIEFQRLRAIAERHDLSKVSLSETLDRFAGLRVLVVGDTVLDRYVLCDAMDVASEAPMMSLAKLDEQCFVGGAAIVARHVAAMGATPYLLSAVANDEHTAQVERVLAEEGVQAHLLRCRPSLVQKTRYLVDETKLFKVDDADCVPLDSLAERRAVSVLAERSEKADVVIFCDFGFGMITASLLDQTLEILRTRVETITADISGSRANLSSFVEADLLCPTERELRSNLNDYDRGLSSVAHRLLEITRARHLFVTVEKKGLVMFDRPSQDRHSSDWAGRLLSEHLPSFRHRPLDCLGGGDALLACASLALAAGAPLMHAAYLGNAAAALEIARLGNVPVSAGSLREWTAARNDLPSAPSPVRTLVAGAV